MDDDVTSLPPPAQLRVALVGYGEVGGILGRALVARGVADVAAYDVLLPDARASAAMRERAVRDGVELRPTAALAVADADVVVSAVTASNTRAAAASVANAMRRGAFLLDVNSASIVIESFLAARRYGVEKEVLASLAETFPGMDWERTGDYYWSRVIRHGKRRAEEMREAAATVREAGLAPIMASAIAERHQWVADLAESAALAGAGRDEPWRAQADRVPRDDER